MKIFKLVKTIGKFVVASGVTLVVSTLIKDNTTTPKGFWKRILMKVGIFALSGVAVKYATSHFGDSVDEVEKETEEVLCEFKEFDKVVDVKG